jgi:hypothetical protein
MHGCLSFLHAPFRRRWPSRPWHRCTLIDQVTVAHVLHRCGSYSFSAHTPSPPWRWSSYGDARHRRHGGVHYKPLITEYVMTMINLHETLHVGAKKHNTCGTTHSRLRCTTTPQTAFKALHNLPPLHNPVAVGAGRRRATCCTARYQDTYSSLPTGTAQVHPAAKPHKHGKTARCSLPSLPSPTVHERACTGSLSEHALPHCTQPQPGHTAPVAPAATKPRP